MVLTAQADDALDIAVALDDVLLDHLGSAVPGAAGSLVDDELNALLLAWRQDIETAPFPDEIDLERAA
jgi:anti-sigma-D factor RsdA-like protein